MDDVDRLFGREFASQVFGLFRSWHEERVLDPAGPWSHLTLAMAYATEVHLFITDLNQSPFNVGTRLAIGDFTPEQVAILNDRCGRPLRSEAEIAGFFALVGGHPYLVRRGIHEMAQQGLPFADVAARADRDEGIFGDHLRRMLGALARDADLCAAVRAVLRHEKCPTEESFYRLRSAGIIQGVSAGSAEPRCRLYAAYLERHLL
jgi:hypothetical protein